MAKKKILLLADDLRMSSGIANMSKQLVMGSLQEYDWVQLGAAVHHPEEGKILDLCDDVRGKTGIADAYLKIYPSSGYGTAEKLREILLPLHSWFLISLRHPMHAISVQLQFFIAKS